MTDTELVQRILGGDERLFEEIVTRYLRRVWALCSGYIREMTDCEDVVQESFVQCYRRLNTLRNPGSLAGWLCQVARRECLEFSRAASRRRAAMERYAREQAAERSVAPAADEALHRDEMRRLIRARVDTLPLKYREALLVHYSAGLSVDESAAFLGISPDAMKKRLQLGRDKLRDLLAADVEGSLGADKPRDGLAARIIASIPWGAASWLGETRAIGKASQPWRTTMTTKYVVLTVVAGMALVAGAMYTVSKMHRQVPQAQVAVESAPAAGPVARPLRQPTKPTGHLPQRLAAPKSLEEGQGDLALATVASTQGAAPNMQARAAMEETLDQTCRLSFEIVHLTDVVNFLSQSLETNIVLDYRAVQASLYDFTPPESDTQEESPKSNPFAEYVTDGYLKETLNIQKTPIIEALEALLYPHGLDFVVEPGFLWISTPERIQKEAAREPDERYDRYDTEAILSNERISLRFSPGIHINKILDIVSNDKSFNFAIDSRVVPPPEELQHKLNRVNFSGPRPGVEPVTDGIVYLINLRDLALRDVLKALLRPLNLTYTVEDGYLWISSPRLIELDRNREPVLPPPDSDVGRFLANEIELQTGDIHLAKLLPYLPEAIRKKNAETLSTASSPVSATTEEPAIRFAVDATVVPPPGETGRQYATDGIIVSFSARNLPASAALDALLHQLGLSFVVKDSDIWISTPERLRAGNFETWKLLERAPVPEQPTAQSGNTP
ncbi:MAG: sigma-70 family RNA polymerase sigma factor [Candidatus Hydrogenedentes bacterium]|nr:sigma-70 family RNA polymerase sigma factor [Candidatus Hydrogenedentota bacterium]